MPDEYIAHFEPIAKRRVVLAAYRLAFMIETVFDKEWKEEEIIETISNEIEEEPVSKFGQSIQAFNHFMSTLNSIWF